jgi:hypothetical protein
MGARAVVALLALVGAGCEGSQGAAASLPVPTASALVATDAALPVVTVIDAGPEMSVAKPLSPRLAEKLAKSAEASQAAAPAFAKKYGGGAMQVVDDTFVVVAGEKT